jgi:hypothetical protein
MIPASHLPKILTRDDGRLSGSHRAGPGTGQRPPCEPPRSRPARRSCGARLTGRWSSRARPIEQPHRCRQQSPRLRRTCAYPSIWEYRRGTPGHAHRQSRAPASPRDTVSPCACETGPRRATARCGEIGRHEALGAARHCADRRPPGLGAAVSLLIEHAAAIPYTPDGARVVFVSRAMAMQARPR